MGERNKNHVGFKRLKVASSSILEVKLKAIDYWRLADQLTVTQAALLICGYDPSELQDSVYRRADVNPHGFVAVRHALKSAIQAETFNHRESLVVDTNDGEYYPDDDLALVKVDEIKAWLSNKGIKRHFFFFPEEPEGEFLSPTHPRYSPKLAAAVRAWQAMEDEKLHGRTAKQSVKKWLRLHCTDYELSDDEGKPLESAIEEIAKIVNWNPRGGAPSAPSTVGSSEPAGISTALTALDKNFAVTEEKKIGFSGITDLDLDAEIPF